MTKKLLKENELSRSTFIGNEEPGVISFGSGQPDLPPPGCVSQIMPGPENHRYGLVQGDLNLREKLSEQYPYSLPGNFVITNGASEALDLSLRAISRNKNIQKKNKVLLLKPYYYSYLELIKYSNMEPIFAESVKGRFNLEGIEDKLSECKAIIINSPSNPTGRVESIETLKKIEELTEKLGVYVLSDEVYKDLIYERDNYLIRGPHVVTINSFSKTYNMCGDRVGYLWSLDKKLIEEVIEMKSNTSMNTNRFAQKQALEAMSAPEDFIQKQKNIWQERRDVIYDRMKELGLDVWKPEGAFYILPKIANPKQFVLDMYNKHNVITYLGEWFGAPDRVRFSYALNKDKIEEGMKRVGEYLKER